MSNYLTPSFLQSAPIKIHFAGFESDTLKLQQSGWRLAIEDSFDHILYNHRIRFILRHDMLMLDCITEFGEINFEDIYSGRYQTPGFIFNIIVIGKEIFYTSLPEFKLHNTYEIDAQPQIIDFDYSHKSLSNLQIFRSKIMPDNALIVEPDQISALLEKIVAAQAPKQAEIRDSIRRNEARQTLHAQILTVSA